MVLYAGPVFEELHTFLCVCIRFFRDETVLQLLEPSSTMVKSNRLAGGRLLPLLQECLEDLAILRRLTV